MHGKAFDSVDKVYVYHDRFSYDLKQTYQKINKKNKCLPLLISHDMVVENNQIYWQVKTTNNHTCTDQTLYPSRALFTALCMD